MQKSSRYVLLIALSTALFIGAALATLRAVGQAATAPVSRPPASQLEESATIQDDPTVAPDPAQSADHNVSFPSDI
ncbi:MAG TPA: hypothetical protein VIY54_00045 [Steroidobacteraceae bacterium]